MWNSDGQRCGERCVADKNICGNTSGTNGDNFGFSRNQKICFKYLIEISGNDRKMAAIAVVLIFLLGAMMI